MDVEGSYMINAVAH